MAIYYGRLNTISVCRNTVPRQLILQLLPAGIQSPRQLILQLLPAGMLLHMLVISRR